MLNIIQQYWFSHHVDQFTCLLLLKFDFLLLLEDPCLNNDGKTGSQRAIVGKANNYLNSTSMVLKTYNLEAFYLYDKL